jgi:hypothetical protein
MTNALLSVGYVSKLVQEASKDAGHAPTSVGIWEDPNSRNLQVSLSDANGNHFTFNVGLKEREMTAHNFSEWLIALYPLAFTLVPK